MLAVAAAISTHAAAIVISTRHINKATASSNARVENTFRHAKVSKAITTVDNSTCPRRRHRQQPMAGSSGSRAPAYHKSPFVHKRRPRLLIPSCSAKTTCWISANLVQNVTRIILRRSTPRRRRSTSSLTHLSAERARGAPSFYYQYATLFGMMTTTDMMSSAPSSLENTLVATIHVTNVIILVVMTGPHVCQARPPTMTPHGRRCSVDNGASLNLSGVRSRERGERGERYRSHQCRLRGSGRDGLAKLKTRSLPNPTSSLKRFA
jgi:hypothetical protein